MEETDYFEECFREGALTAGDIENLRAAVLSKYFRRAVKAVLEGVQGKQRELVAANLGNPEGIAGALKTQGQVQGMQFVISELFQLAMQEEEEEEEKSDGRE